MKTYLITLGLALALAGCSEESKVKSAALEGAKERFEKQVREDIAKTVTGKENLQRTAVKTLSDKAEYEVQKIEMSGNEAHVVTSVKTVPYKERQALIEIMAKLPDKKEATFNVSNALNLIHQQMQSSEDSNEEALVYKINLRKKDGWKAEAP